MEQIGIFQTIILNRQGWPDFLTTWVKIRNFLSIVLLGLPCYSAYWWVVRLFWSSLGGGVGCVYDVTIPSLLSPGEVNKSTTICRQVVSLQSFEYFDVISMVDNSKDWKIVVDLFFTITFDSLDIHFLWNFLKSYAHKTERNKFCHHHIISRVCTFIKQSSPPISTQEITQLL